MSIRDDDVICKPSKDPKRSHRQPDKFVQEGSPSRHLYTLQASLFHESIAKYVKVKG